MKDQFDREIDYLRISITDRCNFRCKYCMPDGISKINMEEILSYEEIIRLVKVALKLGIKKIKITGGEPLVRRGCCGLLRSLKEIEGLESVTLTTNGYLIDQYIQELVDAKVDAVNVSLDTLDAELFREITSVDGWSHVYNNIQLLLEKGIPTKINTVSFDRSGCGVEQGGEWKKFAELAKMYPLDVRFIEVMPIGFGKNYQTINHMELLEKLKKEYPGLHKDTIAHGNGPAIYYKSDDFKGSLGFISAIHGMFCESCNRIRLTSTGYLKACLCYQDGENMQKLLRDGSEDFEIEQVMKRVIEKKPKAHQFGRPGEISEKKTMNEIGG